MKKLILFTVGVFMTTVLFATHNHSGEIIYKQISATQIEACIITYTIASSIPADRDSLFLCWGDGSCDRVSRVNGPTGNGEFIGNDIKRNVYKATHNYSIIGTYVLSMEDPNRNANILNVDAPNSISTPFVLSSEVVLLDPLMNSDLNISPVLLEAPIETAFLGEPFLHTPNAFSENGDSLFYELITPLGVSEYMELTEIGSGVDNTLTLDEDTGLLTWNSPKFIGLYTVAFRVNFYRDGVQIGWIIRDMLIEVEEKPGFAPEVAIQNVTGNNQIIEVNEGDTVRLDITGTDVDDNQQLLMTATGGPFQVDVEPATFNIASGSPVTETFEWIIQAEHIRSSPYQIVFKAVDDTPGHRKSSIALFRIRAKSISTSTVSLDQHSVIKIFPNPVQDGKLNIQFEADRDKFKKYRITNTLGQIVKYGAITSEAMDIDLNGLSEGVYYLSLENKNGLQQTSSFMIH